MIINIAAKHIRCHAGADVNTWTHEPHWIGFCVAFPDFWMIHCWNIISEIFLMRIIRLKNAMNIEQWTQHQRKVINAKKSKWLIMNSFRNLICFHLWNAIYVFGRASSSFHSPPLFRYLSVSRPSSTSLTFSFYFSNFSLSLPQSLSIASSASNNTYFWSH